MRLNFPFFSIPLLINVVICITISVALCTYVYYETKKSYWNVGFNDGTIQANTDMLEKTTEMIGEISKCNFNDENLEHIELLRVKAEFLYLVKSKDGCLHFCK
jgi:hypothetical protein